MRLPPSSIRLAALRGVSTNDAGALAKALCDETAIQAHGSRRRVNFGASLLENGQRARRHHFHPQFLEDSKRSQVNGLDLIRRQHLHGRIGIVDFGPGQLRNAASFHTSAAAPLTSAARVHDRIVPRADLARLRQIVQHEARECRRNSAVCSLPLLASLQAPPGSGPRPLHRSRWAIRHGTAAGCRRATAALRPA